MAFDEEVDLITSQVAAWTVGVENEPQWFDLESAGRLLADTREIIDAAKALERAVTELLVELIPRDAPVDQRTVEGVGVLEVHGGGPKSVKYDVPMVLSAAAAHLADLIPPADPETGELTPMSVVIARAVAETASLCSADTPGYSKFRKGQAAHLGLDLSKYELERSEERTARTIQVH